MRNLQGTQVGVDILLHSGIDIGDVLDLIGRQHGFKNLEQHPLLTIHAVHVSSAALAPTAVVEHLLTIHVLHALLGTRGRSESHGDIHVVIHAAHGVDHVLDHVHAEADVVVDL